MYVAPSVFAQLLLEVQGGPDGVGDLSGDSGAIGRILIDGR